MGPDSPQLLIKPANGFLLMRKAGLMMTNRWEQWAKRRHAPHSLLGGPPPHPLQPWAQPGAPDHTLKLCICTGWAWRDWVGRSTLPPVPLSKPSSTSTPCPQPLLPSPPALP